MYGGQSEAKPTTNVVDLLNKSGGFRFALPTLHGRLRFACKAPHTALPEPGLDVTAGSTGSTAGSTGAPTPSRASRVASTCP